MPVPLRFKSVSELNKQYDLNLSGVSTRSLLMKVDQIYDKANLVYNNGDEEEAYILFMKFLSVIAHIQKSREFKEDPKYHELLIGNKRAKIALDCAESLITKLTSRYDELKNDQVNNKITETGTSMKLQKDLVDSSTPDMRVKRDKTSCYISAVDLFNLMRDGSTKLLLIDVRSHEDYDSNRIDEDFVMNIPGDLILPGQSAHVLENLLPPDLKLKWKQRGNYDEIILLDYNSIESKLNNEDKVVVLQNILTKWDRVKYKNPIRILNGGFDDWFIGYPWKTTNPQHRKTSTTMSGTFDKPTVSLLDNVNYPNLKQLSWETELFNQFVDRSNKPKEDNFERTSTSSGGGGSRPPLVDRAKKDAALKTYEERRQDMARLLKKKEIETARALELEKAMLVKEKELNETLRLEKESEASEEQRQILIEAEEKLLLKMEELREESKNKDMRIEELEEIIKAYKSRDDEDKFEKDIEKNLEKESEEVEMKERIKQQEEEKESVIREREEEEKLKELEKKNLEEKLKEKLKVAREKKKKEIEQEIVGEELIPENVVLRPVIDRTVKPKPIYRDTKMRDFSPVSGKVGSGLTGLKNLGNTCYMNSIVQCISNNTLLATYFCGNSHLRDINRHHKSRGEIAEEVGAVVRALWSGKFRCIASKDLKYVVGRMKPEYSDRSQQDSHEFLTFLMDWLHDDLNQVDPNMKSDVNVKYKSEIEREWAGFRSKNESFISALFFGLQKSTVTCLRCNEQSITYEPFSNLSLILPPGDNVTLELCLSIYLKSERITGWKCPRCGFTKEAKKKIDICKVPPILVIHLKRFDCVEILSRKRTTYVDFPISDLNMNSYVSEKQRYWKYNLYAVSNHYGTMEGGHYTAYCKNCLYDTWYKFDDHDVIEISPSDVKTSAAYILFYSAVSTTVPQLTS